MKTTEYTEADHQRFTTATGNYRSMLQATAQQHVDRSEFPQAGALLVLERLIASQANGYILAVVPLLPATTLEGDDDEEAPAAKVKPAKAAGDHRHKFVDGVCSVCGKRKGAGGRPAAGASSAEPAFTGKVDPPSHDLSPRLLLVSANPACAVGGPHAPSADRRSARCIRCGEKVFITDTGNMAAADAHADGALGSSGVRR